MTSNKNVLISGSAAGFVVDVALFPIDTIKTRMQSKQGLRSLGMKDLHRLGGVGATAIGSMPGSAAFFVTYEGIKRSLPSQGIKEHVLASSCGETIACTIRVPTEVVKQKVQAKQFRSSWQCLGHIIKTQGVRGLYVGYGATILREIPFAAIQYPIWEILQKRFNRDAKGLKAGLFGSVSGAIAGAVTTPIDVLKTRLMTDTGGQGARLIVSSILREEGFRTFMKGLTPRVIWLSMGGFVYLGTYQFVLRSLEIRGKSLNEIK